jgi:hypothetical protein
VVCHFLYARYTSPPNRRLAAHSLRDFVEASLRSSEGVHNGVNTTVGSPSISVSGWNQSDGEDVAIVDDERMSGLQMLVI